MEEEFPYPTVSDTSLKGLQVYMGSNWAAGVWDENLTSNCNHIISKSSFETDNINVLVLWPKVVGLKRWATLL